MIYLGKVYRYNKWMFAAMVAFILLQLFFSFRGITTSPWYNAGMYSEVIKPQQIYYVYDVSSRWPDNIRLLSPQWDDKVFFTLDRYNSQATNDTLYKKIKRSYSILHLPAPDSSHFLYKLYEREFNQWFGVYAGAWLRRKYADSIDAFINPKQARWNGKMLSFAKEPY